MNESMREHGDLLENLGSVAIDMQNQLTPAARVKVQELVASPPDWQVPREIDDLGPLYNVELRQACQLGSDATGHFGAALVAQLATGLPRRLAERRVPADVMARVPAALDRLVRFLRTADLAEYHISSSSNDYFLKDIRFAAGLTVPCGAQVVDLRSLIGRRRTLAFAMRKPSPGALAALLGVLKVKAVEPWLAPHTESRYLDEFDEPGWDRAYLHMASLLKAHEAVRGVVATSWFYDPAVSVISPRLAYLRMRPLERGAILMRSKTSSFHIEKATATSPTRRKLHAEGRYHPTPYTVLWGRRELLAWARAQEP